VFRSEWREVEGFCEHCNELAFSMEFDTRLDYLITRELLKKNFAAWNYLLDFSTIKHAYELTKDNSRYFCLACIVASICNEPPELCV